MLNGRRIRTKDCKSDLILLAIEDVTARNPTEPADMPTYNNPTGTGIQRSRTEVQSLTAQIMRAQDGERRRIARELHDSIAQQLALIEMEFQAFVNTFDALPGVAAGVGRIGKLVAGVSEEVRRVSHNLHPSILDDLGLKAALHSLSEEFEQAHDIPVRLTAPIAEGDIPVSLSVPIYRVAQEALHNVAKYAATRWYISASSPQKRC